MKWYLIRHGEIKSNKKKVYAGWSEEGLTRRGTRQAKKAAGNMLFKGIDAIYCSPLKRTVQTAKIIGNKLKIEPVLNSRFKELKLGIWEGLSEADVRGQFPKEWMTWHSRPAELHLEGRETLAELRNRVMDGIDAIRAEVKSGSVLIVTHVAIIRILLLCAKKSDLNLYKTIPVPNAGIYEIDDNLLNANASYPHLQRRFYGQGILDGSGAWDQASALNG